MQDSLVSREQLDLPAEDVVEQDAPHQNGVETIDETIAATEVSGEEAQEEIIEPLTDLVAADGTDQSDTMTAEELPDEWVQTLFDDQGSSRSAEPEATLPLDDELWLEPVVDDFESTISEPEADEFVEPVYPAPAPAPAPAVATPAFEPARPAPSRAMKRGGRWTSGLLLTSLILLGLGLTTLFINPFARLAMNSATLGQAVAAPAVAPPQSGSGNWCVSGDFLNSGNLRLADGGNQGDILVGDNVFSLNHTVAQPGAYNFQVIDCDNPDLAYPETAAWLKTTQPNQQVTFLFDTSGRSAPLFGATPFVVSAIDGTNNFQVIGSFQNWDESDANSKLEMISDGLYQQVRRIALPGSYEAQIMAEESTQSVDAFGRTDDPISLSFATKRNGEPVIFLLDTDRGQASVLYDMSPLLASLAFNNGYRLISYILLGLAGLLLLLMAARLSILNNDRLRMEHGCPQCGQPELMRISRESIQRLQNSLGIPAYRYRCRNCTWEGTRLSDMGEPFSPGALFAHSDER